VSVHELSIGSAIVDTAVRHAGGRRVTGVKLRVGHLRQVVPDSLAFYWDIVTRDGLCEGYALEQELIAARLECTACARGWEIELPVFRCPTCGGADVEIAAGDELEVESIEVEEEPACTA